MERNTGIQAGSRQSMSVVRGTHSKCGSTTVWTQHTQGWNLQSKVPNRSVDIVDTRRGVARRFLVAEIVLQRVSNINISSNIRRTTATCLPPITPASPSGRPISTPPPATPTNNEIRLGRGGQKHALLQLLCRGEGWLPPCCRMYSASSESKASCKVEVL